MRGEREGKRRKMRRKRDKVRGSQKRKTQGGRVKINERERQEKIKTQRERQKK